MRKRDGTRVWYSVLYRSATGPEWHNYSCYRTNELKEARQDVERIKNGDAFYQPRQSKVFKVTSVETWEEVK